MQLIPSQPKEVAKGFPPLRAVSNELLRANIVFSDTLESLENAGGHTKNCLKCGSSSLAFGVPVLLKDEHFSMSLPISLCRKCTDMPPVYPFVEFRNFRKAWMKIGLSVASWLVLLVLSVALPTFATLFGFAAIGIFILVTFTIMEFFETVPIDPKLRDSQTIELIHNSPHFGKMLKAFPNAKLLWQDVSPNEDTPKYPWTKDFERECFQQSFTPYERGFVMADLHSLDIADGSMTLCTEVFRYLSDTFRENFRSAQNDPVAAQALITFLPGRKREVQVKISPSSNRAIREKIRNKIESMPDFPVQLPVVVLYRTCNFQGMELANELAIPDPAVEFQRYVRGLSQEDSVTDEKATVASDGFSDAQFSDAQYVAAQRVRPENTITADDFIRWSEVHPNVNDLTRGFADFLLSKGEIDAAIEVWEKDIAKEPPDRNILGLFANFLERCERLEKAASICQTITKRPDATPDDFAYLAHLQLALGFPAEASKTLQNAPAGYRSADYYFSSARIAQALNQPDECMEFLGKAIGVDATYTNAYLLRANLGMAERNYDKAIADIERFLEIEGPSYRGYQIKASALAKSKGYQAAIEFLTDRINEHGNHPLLNGLRAEAYRESGKHELALDDCNWILEQYPDFHPARLQRAELRIDTDDPAGAIADAKSIVDAGGDDATLYATLGFAYHLDNQSDQALEWLQRAVQLDPRHIGARYRLSQVYTNAGRIDESIEQLTALLAIDGKQSIPLVVRGYQHLMQTSRDKAEQDFQDALELSPREVQAIRGMALVAELRGDHKEAIQYLDKALAIDPENEECLLDRSRLAMSDYNLKAAEKDLDQVIASSPHLLPALFTRAQLHIQLGRMDQALNDLDTILKENPDFAPALIGRSAIHEIQGNEEKSQEDFDAAVELEPESADETEQQRALIASQIALAQNRFEEAIEAATLAIELNPTNEQGYLRRGGAYWYSDQFSEGWEDYNYILETLNADSISARNGRGGCAAELGEYDVAIKDLNLAVDEARKSDTHVLPYCLNNLARALIGNDQLEEADSVLKESLDLQPRNAWVYFNRGLLRLAQKNPILALEDFQAAVAASEPRLPPRKLAKAKAFIERAEKESKP